MTFVLLIIKFSSRERAGVHWNRDIDVNLNNDIDYATIIFTYILTLYLTWSNRLF